MPFKLSFRGGMYDGTVWELQANQLPVEIEFKAFNARDLEQTESGFTLRLPNRDYVSEKYVLDVVPAPQRDGTLIEATYYATPPGKPAWIEP